MAEQLAIGRDWVAYPAIRRIGLADLRAALAAGYADFAANRTDVVFLCLLYPVLGLVLSRLAVGYQVLPLLFPLAAGFALLGPVAGTGLYEMSRQRAAGHAVSFHTAFDVLRRPGLGAIVLLGLLLAALFLVWLQVALAIYETFLGAGAPLSPGDFLHAVFATAAGWRMIIVGDAVGLLFALLVFAVGVVSFPMLIDGRHGSTTGERLSLAVGTSLRAVAANRLPMLAWGLIVVAALVLGSLLLFVGLIVVLPVLGHATWHLYRRIVA